MSQKVLLFLLGNKFHCILHFVIRLQDVNESFGMHVS